MTAQLWKPHSARCLPVPRPAPRSTIGLERAVGRYKFGLDFYQLDATVEVAVRDGALDLRYPKFTATVTPLADGSCFDRTYWSFHPVRGQQAGLSQRQLRVRHNSHRALRSARSLVPAVRRR